MKKLLIAFFIMFGASYAFGAVINVPTDYSAIQEAIDASSNGDIIEIAAGTYYENLVIENKTISILGAGKEVTFLRPYSTNDHTMLITGAEAMEVVFSGFTVEEGSVNEHTVRIVGSLIKAEIADNIFRGNLIEQSSNIEVISCEAEVNIHHNIFANNGGIGCIGFRSGTQSQAVNNSIYFCTRGIFSIAGGGVCMNNTITNCDQGINALTSSDFDIIDYNNVWSVSDPYGYHATPGANDISADPLFVDADYFDFQLQETSPLIDAGNPAWVYQDADGTINDIGAVAFLHDFPIPFNLSILNELSTNVVNNPVFSWEFYDTLGSQYAYEIEVGTDNDWTVAEMWSTGVVVSGDTSAVYGGSALVDGMTYYYRVRINNGTDWGNWITRIFTMNTPPPQPNAISPVDNQNVLVKNLELLVDCLSDIENDEIKLEFEVYSDAGLIDLVESVTDVLRTGSTVTSGYLSNLLQENSYWWRARAFDGFEYSDWCPTESFYTEKAAVRVVPDQYPTIASAIEASSSFDTVYVKSGTYQENVNFGTKILILLGESRFHTIIEPPSDGIIDFDIRPGAVNDTTIISDITVRNAGNQASTVQLNGNNIIINNCIFADNVPYGSYNIEVISVKGSYNLFKNNVFYGNGGIGCIGIRSGADNLILNNTINGNERGIYSVSIKGASLINNIVTNNGFGINTSATLYFDSLEYNDVWNNSVLDYGTISPSPTDISADPLFIDPNSFIFGLLNTSPCIDAGHPDPIYNDTDGSRSDIGAQWGDYQLPIAGYFTILNNDQYHVVDENPEFSWQFVDVDGYQSSFEIEIGIDADWSVAENWSSGEVISSDTSIVYVGLPLEDGTTYYYRIRLKNGTEWGGWLEGVFKTNIIPMSPLLVSPQDLSSVPIYEISLFASGASDADGDDILYEFEIYSDNGLLNPDTTISNIPEQPDSTGSGLIVNLSGGNQYWWRARVTDGYEFSEWSAARSFETTNTFKYIVPDQYPTISSAIEAASDGDTIFVRSGVYKGFIDFNEKHLILLGEDKNNTFIESSNTAGFMMQVDGHETSYSYSCEVAGLTFRNGQGEYNTVRVLSSGTYIHDCIFADNVVFGTSNVEVIACFADGVKLERNVFYRNGGNGCIGIRSGVNCRIINNSFYNNENGFFVVPSNSAVAYNNIVIGSERGVAAGAYDSYTEIGYNNVWNNAYDYYGFGTIVVETDISVDPMFLDPDNGHLQLLVGSPCVDAGNPDSTYNDPDGSRNDMGAYDSPVQTIAPTAPVLVEPDLSSVIDVFDLKPSIVWHASENQSNTDLIYYDLTIATDQNFNFSFEINSITDTTYTIADSLDQARDYWMKIRAYDPIALSTTSPVYHFRTWMIADLNHSFVVDVEDLVYMIDFMFRQGSPIEPPHIGDFNGDCIADIEDLVLFVDYQFRDGDAPGLPCQNEK